MSKVVENQIHTIVESKLDTYEKIVDEKIEGVKKDIATTRESLVRVETKMDAIYGNGSGKKGILDRMQEEAKDNEEKSAKFRHDMRNTLQTIQDRQLTEDSVRSTINKVISQKGNRLSSWIRWTVGGLLIVGWELFKAKYLKVN